MTNAESTDRWSYYVSYTYSGGFAGTTLSMSGPLDSDRMINEAMEALTRQAGRPIVIIAWNELSRPDRLGPTCGGPAEEGR